MRRKTLVRIVTMLLPLALLVSAATVAQARVGNLVETVTDADIVQVLKANNYEFQPKKPGVFGMKIHGLKVLLFRKDSNLQLYAGFSKKGVSLATINKWNKGKRFSRAYIDSEGDPVIESDMDLEGGVSLEAIKVFIETFKMSLGAFVREVVKS